MKINWFSFIGHFSCLFSLRVFLICRPCLFNNTRLPLHLNNSNLLQFTCHCYAEQATQKRARERIVLTPRYVWDVYLCSLTQTIAWGVDFLLSSSNLSFSCTCKGIVKNFHELSSTAKINSILYAVPPLSELFHQADTEMNVKFQTGQHL